MKNAKFNILLEICTMLLLNYPILGWKSRVKPFFMKYFEALLPTRHLGRNTAKLKRNFPRFPAQMPVIDENEMCNGSLKVLFQKSLQWWEPEVRTPKLRRLLCNRRSRSHARPRIGFALTIAPSSTSYRPTISSACAQLWSVRPLFASSIFPRQKLTQLISISSPPSFNPTLFRVLAMGAGSLDPWPLGFASYLAVNRFPSSLNGFFIPKEEPAQYMWKWSISAQWKSLNESVSREKRPLHDFYLWDMYEAQV